MQSVPAGLQEAIEKHHAAANEFLNGNPEPWKSICSQRADVTILGGWGGHERGWAEQFEKRYEWASARCQGVVGSIVFEPISLVASEDMAYSVDVERAIVRLRGLDREVPIGLRVTTIFRVENGEWKMAHRHADPLLTIQDAGAVIQK